ncbi:WD40-repeat-containing domain protein [Pseudomassariella vexata]|uniref:WD40-repeat-containing domain protein n=1 Tax=Pseudomassariella vexata TaxID=1141098 RepID=A0A1Y2DGW3_9PEZI|nr:WD40-repeat-containing domain protein [Pseudomassariella vexata]ORY58501.1 WD40-repeat-containing domain protein [Pseudomassariella vexata]
MGGLRLKVKIPAKPDLPKAQPCCTVRSVSRTIQHERIADIVAGDGTWSPSDEDQSGSHDTSTTTPVTLPRIRSPRPGLPSAFWQLSVGATPSKRGGSSQYPDRFVPSREHSTPVGDRFRTNKQAHELSTSERLIRNEAATPDAFCFRPHRRRPTASTRRSSRSDNTDIRGGTLLGLNDPIRQISVGAVWTIGGTAPSGSAVDSGRGRYIASGTNAPLYTTSFSSARPRSEEEQEKHEGRLAYALNIDRAQRILDFDGYSTFPRCKSKIRTRPNIAKTTWTGTEWSNQDHTPKRHAEGVILPNAPFKVLDAPGLRDDFYCSMMAYSETSDTLAVGLGNAVYGWSEPSGVMLLHPGIRDPVHQWWLTSLAFSSNQGQKSILALGRSNGEVGSLSLLSMFDSLPPRYEAPMPRFNAYHHSPVACLSWRPVDTKRPSLNPSHPGFLVENEDLLVVSRDNWPGAVTLLARIKPHTQQVCGLAWSPDGEQFATGGNDNLCCLYSVDKILEPVESRENSRPVTSTTSNTPAPGFGTAAQSARSTDRIPELPRLISPTSSAMTNPWSPTWTQSSSDPIRPHSATISPLPATIISPLAPEFRSFSASDALQVWPHQAAVKAIAFCPWRPNLLATGGGSNDKMIHFFHTSSGATLATISVSAQVTSLIWSTTRREIAATFGFAQPDHNVRIAVFSWPECRQVAAVKWDDGKMGNDQTLRALYAVAYPGGPGGMDRGGEDESRRRGRNKTRTEQEGCIVVACSDKSVKFHEVWVAGRKATTGMGAGVLGGSDILEMGEGIDKEGDVIR